MTYPSHDTDHPIRDRGVEENSMQTTQVLEAERQRLLQIAASLASRCGVAAANG